MVQLRGLTVSVLVGGRDGQPATEYPDEEGSDLGLSSTNHYIEAHAGKEFAFKFEWDHSIFVNCVAFRCKIYVDGVRVEHPPMSPEGTQPRICTGPSVNSNGSWTEQPLVFSEIELDEGNPSADKTMTWKEVDQLGLISIKVMRLSKIWKVERPTYAATNLKSQSIPEKVLKGQAIDTKSRLGNSRSSRGSTRYDSTELDSLSNPHITFNLKYRSRKALQSMYIIPRSPTPEPLENRPVESLSREELLELVKRRGAFTAALVKPEDKVVPLSSLKRERDDEVVEILASARVTRRKTRVEVVDLLDD